MNIKDITGSGATYNVQTMNVIVVGNQEEADKVVNPGMAYGDDGKAKWNPPLQQQLLTMKDAVGPTTDDVTTEPTEQEVDELSDDDSDRSIDRIKKLAAIFSPSTAHPVG
jgi:hypothetical protein